MIASRMLIMLGNKCGLFDMAFHDTHQNSTIVTMRRACMLQNSGKSIEALPRALRDMFNEISIELPRHAPGHLILEPSSALAGMSRTRRYWAQ